MTSAPETLDTRAQGGKPKDVQRTPGGKRPNKMQNRKKVQHDEDMEKERADFVRQQGRSLRSTAKGSNRHDVPNRTPGAGDYGPQSKYIRKGLLSSDADHNYGFLQAAKEGTRIG